MQTTSIDPQLIAELEECTKYRKSGKAHKMEFSAWGFPSEVKITRWKFNEFDYYNEKSNLPINARGLFTLGDRVLLRSYNKFFNTGETKATQPENLKEETRGPYHATVKENGYLVLIGALDGKILVTSKNSSGPRDSINGLDDHNHARVAREWVLRQLKAVGRTEEEFAEVLASNCWTAVGEACDDSFEEHVLAYPPQDAGIYLNGLNFCGREFITEPPQIVRDVAREFGFKETDFLTFDELPTLTSFLEEREKDGGSWHDGREIEGAVIRCQRRNKHDPSTYENFFWKYKFEEPYLMYREWREVLKIMLRGGIHEAAAWARRSKHYATSIRFARFASTYLASKPKLIQSILTKSIGFLEVRGKFIEAHGGTHAVDAMMRELDLESLRPKYVLVTVATIGCGKSTVAEAITQKLMARKWGHWLSDNIPLRKKGKVVLLVNQVVQDFAEKEVVVLDRNNSSADMRKDIITNLHEAAGPMGYDLKIVCLNFLPQGPQPTTCKLTRDRVLMRGDNHQSVKLSKLNAHGVMGIMRSFERSFQAVNTKREPDNAFDLVIDLEAGESVENVAKILNTLRSQNWPDLTVPQFTQDEIAAAVDGLIGEQKVAPSTVDTLTTPKNKRSKKGMMEKVSYIGIGIDEEGYGQLVAQAALLGAPLSRIKLQPEFHVTLAHKRSHPGPFNTLKSQNANKIKAAEGPGRVQLDSTQSVRVTHIYWSNRIIAFRVETVGCHNEQAHITVGTIDNVPAYEANKLFVVDPAETVIKIPLAAPIELHDQLLFASP